MTNFTQLKGFFYSSLLFTLLVNDAWSQSGSASPSSVSNSSAANVVLTGTPTSNRRFINTTSWSFVSGPQNISVGSTTFSPNASTNNNSVSATASFPSGAAMGTYTFKLTYTLTTNSSGSSSTTGSLNVTVMVAFPPPPNPAPGNANNCTTNASITTCPQGSSGIQTSFINGIYNRGNDANHLGVGAIWRFTNITTANGNQVNAEVKIDAIFNATLENSGSGGNSSSTAKIEDDNALNQSNASIASYFAPRISPNVSGNGDARGYAQFTLTFYKNTLGGFTELQNLEDLNFVHLDIDGNGNSSAWFRETGVALKAGSNPSVIANSNTELVGYSYSDNSTSPGGDWSGYAGSVYERSGVSVCAEVAVAYRYTGTRNSVTFRMGYDYKGTGNPGTSARQYGATFGCFNFPTEITLPVKLTSFKGNVENNTAKLSWESAAEENVSGYTVQRSFNGNDWSDIGEVAAANRPNMYIYNDPLVNNPEKIYYRLKIGEVAGGYSYSGVIVLKTSATIGSITVAPNPFKNNIQFSITSSEAQTIRYTLLNSEGKQLRISSQKLSRGSNVLFINDLESLQTGVYFLQVQYNDQMKTIKLLKTDR